MGKKARVSRLHSRTHLGLCVMAGSPFGVAGPETGIFLSGALEILKNKTPPPDCFREQRGRGAQLVHFQRRGRVIVFMLAFPFFGPALPGVLGYGVAGARFTFALEAFTQPPLGESAVYPSRWVGVQRAGRASRELLVDRGCGGCLGGPRCRLAHLRADSHASISSCPRRGQGSGTFPLVSRSVLTGV